MFKLKQLDIDFNEKEHTYTRKKDGKLLAGVSSVSELAKGKEFVGILNQWAANCACNHIFERWDIAKEYNQEEKDALLKEAKTAHRNLSKEAKDIGTEIHDLLQQYVQGKIDGRKVKLDVKDENIKRAITQFVYWERENKVEFLASELMVGDEDGLEVAGRLDCLALVNGKRTILDWKVANNIGSNYFLQLAGYWLCLEVMGWQPEKRMLVRIPKTDIRKVWNDKLRKYEMKENNLEVIEPPTDILFDIETFKHFRIGFKWLNQQALNEKI